MSVIEQVILIYTIFQMFVAPMIIFLPYADTDILILNPKSVYENSRCNYFGAWCIAIFTWISCMPWAIGYWIYKAFTVGG